MSSKHFVNEPLALVNAALRSATYTNPSVAFDAAQKTVFLRDAATQPTVALISGGGSGHEPSFAGFVGKGFLTAAVAGSVFASPSAEQVFRAIRRVGAEQPRRGVLVLIMNYTGDMLHFGMAVEKARAEGIKTELLVVGDDVGVGRKRGGRIGRRGLAGTVLVQKIAAAAAAQGQSLEQVSQIASLASDNLATVGASLSHVHVPGREITPDELGDEIEIGMGIHNEEGFGRVKTTLKGLVETMLKQLLDQSDSDRAYINVRSGDEVVVMVNNLGGISPLELGAITTEVIDQLDASYQIKPARLLSGTYMTSLNGLGFSITILKATDKAILPLIDAPADAAGWSPAVSPENWARGIDTTKSEVKEDAPAEDESAPSNLDLDAAFTTAKLQSALKSLIASEHEITKFDTIVGDGDCGLCLKTGAEAVLKHLDSVSPSGHLDVVRFVRTIAQVIESNMDGTSGALYAIFTNALASGLQGRSTSQKTTVTTETWATALQAALKSLARYTPAQPGDRTVVDALVPFVNTLAETLNLARAVEAAKKGSDSTKGMEASLGRSVYVNAEGWNECPDPGAHGLVKLLEGFLV
ncbi:dihydroxyacetone kinase [Trichoderma citrinoviride]|uniref:Dihydroxyacetone kinase n=1 Tax=Trichoderma citrinoviride TaxID=58853 RepID=A0A2T4BG59_9HYPO|nr:dihydroxyacetone kinase [Trichoderma citrinoviride]PTB68258.1 dihydroxyacetone kinase [Trichoderma citrinoviride]